MCGIAGVMTLDGSEPDAGMLDRLADALDHRGPDGRGRYVAPGIGLVHDRLAIIDLDGGAQPLFGVNDTTLVANGEIYNYRELRAELGAARFATGSDCEPILALYERDGPGCVESLRGMYALALYDGSSRCLVLARDPFGIKPLYAAETDLGLVFASEPQALISAGLVTPRLDVRAMAQLLQLQFTTGPETIFQGIRRIMPGETWLCASGQVAERSHRAALPSEPRERWSEEEALKKFDEAFLDSVAAHQRADVEYGLFLSGGIDSSAVLAAMARLNERPVKAFTAGFAGAGVADERAHARTLARTVGAEHVEVELTEEDFWTMLPGIAAATDDPAADYALLPSSKLAATVSGQLKVVLTGEGGDELFAGYGRYRRALRSRWLGGRALRARGFFDGLELLRKEPVGWRHDIEAAERTARAAGRSRLQAVQAADCADWLPHDLLLKLDRCLMAYGVEGRTPFLDPVMAAFAMRLPDNLKLHRGTGKWLLRRWLERHLPEARPFSAKRGFSVPVADWIGREGARLGPLLARDPAVAEVCRPGAVERLMADPGVRSGLPAWTLLYYALWHRRHIRGVAPVGDVFSCLES